MLHIYCVYIVCIYVIISDKIFMFFKIEMEPRLHVRKGLNAFYVLLALCIVLSDSVPFPPKEEVEALREIGDQLQKSDWNFSLNPCDNNTNWASPERDDDPYYHNTVICDNCSAIECHVTHINLKGQDLSGVLPPSLAKLPYIIHFDVWANYLNGTIPEQWSSTKLQYLALGVNRLSGRVPDFLGNITTLTYLSLESNMFSEQVPASLGALVNLETLILSTNNLTGGLPKELSHLTKLSELRLSRNKFVGKFPDFSSLLSLTKLEIQGTGFEGPIPSSLSLLNNLTDLKIADLNGESSDFPQLGHMAGMERLMLRSCNISAKIPDDILKLTGLNIMDLSYNKLHGEPPNLGGLRGLRNLYLINNLLSGPIPSWAQNAAANLVADLSFNNFSGSNFSSSCRDNVNLFRSISGMNSLLPSNCLPNCTKDWYSFHINCGGTEVRVNGHTYEADEAEEAEEGLTKFFYKENWGSSSSGRYWDLNRNEYHATAKNISEVQADHPGLYVTARLAPLSLTYYGRCLANGMYTVQLHFAEITFTNNDSYKSLGRRIFDIYIQDELIWKDFNIEVEAGGVNKAVKKDFKASVNNSILEMRFTWAGQGTTAVPHKGNYGPLISAISVESDSGPPSNLRKSPPSNLRKKILIISAVVLLCLIGVAAVMYLLWRNGYFSGRTSMLQEWKDLDLPIGFFSMKQIKAATRDFHAENKIGQGGFGAVYKGKLLDGTVIAVKQLSSVSKQGAREFVTEVGMISGLQHPNLVKLYGCCVEGRQLILVYEYLENNCLGRALFGEEKSQLKLDWPTRQRICLGIAKGLAFIHEESPIKVVHRDIKATNILLDAELNPKISDFGLAKLDEEENTHISTRVAGTIGYMAPEYALWGYLTFKADVYSFGIVVLELVAGKSNMNYKSAKKFVCLLDKALVLEQADEILDLVDPKLESNYNVEEATRIIKVALLCTNPSPALRPTMSSVVSMLEGKTSIQENVHLSSYDDQLKFKSLREKHAELLANHYSTTQSILNSSSSSSSNVRHGGSSASGKDLYPYSFG